MDALGNKRLFLLDMDGTLYLDEFLFPGVMDFLSAVHKAGGRYLFLTNNSSRGVADYVDKLHRLGIAATAADFLTSVDVTVDILQREFPDRRCYVAGTRSFRRQLQDAGIPTTDRVDDEVDILLSGFDRELTFQKLEDSCILLNRGVTWLATNPDWVCPTVYGSVPDCGSVCEMLTRATGRKPRFLGKPQPEMVYLALHRTGFSPERAVVVGDRLYTDIACGVAAGVDTAFVLSGEGRREDVAQYRIEPTWIFDNIAQLYRRWEELQ